MSTSRANRRAAERAAAKTVAKTPRPAPAPAAPSPGPHRPAFWFDFSVPAAKLVAARFLLFALLALDALLQIRHAPRYGAGHFNVAQLPFLDGLGPSRAAYACAELVLAYLFALAAFGVATRIAVPIAAVLYAWLYFGSQLDSYQHHYLVALLLGIACFVPWEARDARTRSWALRLMLVQLGIMYLWAAISKCDAAWLDGRTLDKQVSGSLRSLIDHTVGIATASKLVVVTELALAGMVWNRRAWPIAAPLGIAFHLGIVASGLEIGLFAWLMIAFYALVIPDGAWTAAASLVPTLRAPAVWARLRWGLALLAFFGGFVLAALSRFPYAMPCALAVSWIPLATIARARRPSPAFAHAAALLLWLAVGRLSTVVPDYYRFWGGSARRLADLDASESAYRALVDIAPDDGAAHFQLARTLLARSAPDDDLLAELHAAQTLEPGRARAFLVEAQWLVQHGRRADALDKARAAVRAEPASSDARQLLDTLEGARTPPAPKPTDDDR